MSEPWRTWPVSVLPIRRGRKSGGSASSAGPRAASGGGSRSAAGPRASGPRPGSGRGSRGCWADRWGLKSPPTIRRAAFSLARKYSDSSRWYISRAASKATWRRNLSLGIIHGADSSARVAWEREMVAVWGLSPLRCQLQPTRNDVAMQGRGSREGEVPAEPKASQNAAQQELRPPIRASPSRLSAT